MSEANPALVWFWSMDSLEGQTWVQAFPLPVGPQPSVKLKHLLLSGCEDHIR